MWETNFVAFIPKGFNFDEFKLGGLYEKHAVAAWKLGTISTFS
jgi:hypothetical protein